MSRDPILAWLDRNRRWFAAAAAVDLRLKLLGELALAAELAGRRGWGDRPADLLDYAWDSMGRGDDLALRARQVPALASIYPTFYRVGHRHPAIDAMLDDPTWLGAIPRVPLQLPIELVRRACGKSPRWDLGELVAETSVFRDSPEPGSLAEPLVYAMTHTAFLLTDFGREPAAMPGPARAHLVATLPGWLALYRERGHRDLVAELIMTAHCIGRCVPDSAWAAIDAPVVDPTNGQRFLADYHPHISALMARAMCEHA